MQRTVIRVSDGAKLTTVDCRLVNGSYMICAVDSKGVSGTYKRSELIYDLDVQLAGELKRLCSTGEKVNRVNRIKSFFTSIGIDPEVVIRLTRLTLPV